MNGIPAGRVSDKFHGGVPADHFRRWDGPRPRHRFRDPLIATMAAVAAATGATMLADDGECEDCQQFGADHYGPTSNGTTDKAWDGSASRFSDDEYKMATAACDPGSGTDSGPTIKAGCFLPHHEPSGTINVNGVHAAAQRVSSLKGHDAGAVNTAKGHLRSHYAKLNEDPPDSIKASRQAKETLAQVGAIIALWDAEDSPEDLATQDSLASQFAGLHENFTGTHSHAHSAYGQQGDDSTHEHMHKHDGDNLHRHDHDAKVPSTAAAEPGRRPTFDASFRLATPDGEAGRWERKLEMVAFAASGQFRDEPDPMFGSPWKVRQISAEDVDSDEQWEVLAGSGAGGQAGALVAAAAGRPIQWATAPSYTEAVQVIAQQLAEQMAAGENPGTLDDTWRSEMAFEGVSTGDGRFIEPGAIQYRDCPMPLMLQTETEPGHMGAVLSGFITATGKIGQIAVGTGTFLAADAGRSFVQIINAAGKFGVSIDVAEAEGAPICTTHGTDTDQCDFDCDWEIHFTMLVVMGLTGTPFPAFQDAYIELQSQANSGQAVAASNGNFVYSPAGGWGAYTAGGGGGGVVEWTSTGAVTAGGAVAVAADPDVKAPTEWFAPPGGRFARGDGYLMRMVNGSLACPLTVEDPDPETGLRRVYGHFTDWKTCHTGIRDRCQTAPHSRTNYAAFNLRPIMTAEGDTVRVGHLTMGIGHAELDPGMSIEDVRAHYDGGPGAVRMATVAAGEDEFGGWVCGYIEPGRTDDQIAEFMACSLSGDWREVWRGRGLELVACLAGVTVPGFPMAFVAAGLPIPTTQQIGQTRYGLRNGQVVALVAAGIVHQPMPWERQMAHLEAELDLADIRLRKAEAVAEQLAPLAARAALAEITGQTFAAPTDQDGTISKLLVSALQALHAVCAAQAQDPDNGTDPDDAKIVAHLNDAKQALDQAVLAQAKDGTPDAQAASGDPEPVVASGEEDAGPANVQTLRLRRTTHLAKRTPDAIVVMPEPATTN